MKELILIQNELKVKKDKWNDFGKFKYRAYEDILEALKPLLKENSCAFYVTDDVVMIGDRFYFKATATIINSEGSKITNTSFAREPLSKKGSSDEQVSGSASSYARKYAIGGLFLIDDSEETDAQDNTTVTAIETINKLIKSKKVDLVAFLKYYKVSAISELTFEQQQLAIETLNKK